MFTIAPSVIQIDTGELATVQATLGIAHPTGYPLFTILGYVFSLIPLPFSTIFQLNILAAIYCSGAVIVFVYTSKLMLDNIKIIYTEKGKSAGRKSKNVKDKNKNVKRVKVGLKETEKYISSIMGGIILAFSATFWAQSTSVEVYSLHLLLINLVILFLVKAYLNEDDSYKADIKSWLIFSFFLALGFTNHMTTLLILPGVAYLYFDKNKFSKESFKKILIMLVFFFPVLIIIYLYLPFRASQNPLLNWGNPTDLEHLLRHVSGKQYQVWLFASLDAAKKQFAHFIDALPGEFYLNLIVILVGCFYSYFKARKFFIFLLTTFVFTVLYSINYEIHDIDSYFLLAYIALSFFAVFGIVKLIELLRGKEKNILLPVGIVGALILLQIYFNFSKVNQNDVYIFEDYTKAVLNSVPENSIIFSYQWDYFISASYYFRYVEDFRKDVTVVDKELLRRSWYYDQLNNNYPFLFSKMKNDVSKFKEALIPFERSENFNARLLETLYRKIMTDLVVTNINERSFYIAPELVENELKKGELKLPEGYYLVPDLFLFKVVIGNKYVPAKNPDFKIRLPEEKNYYTKMIETFTGSMLARRAIYEMKSGKINRAKIYLNKIRSDFPDYNIPPGLRTLAGQN